MKKILVCLLVLVLALTCFAACGKKDEKAANPVGTYSAKSMNGKSIEDAFLDEMGGELGDVSLDTILGMLGVSSIDALFSLEIKDDGTFTMTAAGETENGTWVQDGSKITMTVDNEPMDATLDGDELTFKGDGMELVFVKK